MFGATSWALKRLLKFVLKRNLKQWIQTELDLEQLDVQLGQGLLELKEVVLNTDYINERLVGWDVGMTARGSRYSEAEKVDTRLYFLFFNK